MPLVKWDSLRKMPALQDRINHLFDNAFPGINGEEDINMSLWRPVVDIFDEDRHLVVQAELPGMKKENVSVEVKGNILTFKGEKPADKAIPEDRYYRRERRFGAFQRSFTLHSRISPDHISAQFKDGLLEIRIPRPDEDKPRQISVDVE